MAEHGKKCRLYQKILQENVVQNKISYKKLSGHISLSLPGEGIWGFKDMQFFKNLNPGKPVHFRAKRCKKCF